MIKPKIGVALGSGGAKGFAHIGVLKVLEEANIPIDMMAGSSMGALAAALYGVGHDWKSMYKIATAFQRKHVVDWTVPKMGFITGQKATDLIKALTHQKRFEECRIPVVIVATDLLTGERVLFDSGLLYQAVRASISIPGIFVPVKMKGRLLVDGGVVDRVPVTVVKEMGADITIAVDVASRTCVPEIHSIYDVIIQSIDIMQQQIVNLQESQADILIKPPIGKVHSKAFTYIEKIVKIGEETARDRLPDILRTIEAWKER